MEMDTNIFNLISAFLQKKKISFNKEELKFQLLSHPYFPNLVAITDLLDYLGTDSVALKLPANLDTLEATPELFLAQMEGGSMAIAHKKGTTVNLDYGAENVIINQDEFLKLWSGFGIFVEQLDFSVKNKISNIFLYQVLGTLLFIAGFITWFFFSPTLSATLYLSLSILGGVISVLILQQQQGIASTLLSKICVENDKMGCSESTHNKQNVFFGNIHFSDLCVIFFSSTILLSFIYQFINQSPFTIFGLLAILSIPFILYSVYLQSVVQKKWCLLCCSVLAVLFSQIILSIINFSRLETILLDISIAYLPAFIFLLIATIWLPVSILLNTNKELEKTQMDYFKFKRNFKLFNAVWKETTRFETDIANTNEIVLGGKNKGSEIVDIIVVTNPLCYYCKDVHHVVEALLEKYADNIKVTIRLLANPKKRNHSVFQISNRLLDIYQNSDEETLKEALNDIYSADASIEKWESKWKFEATNKYQSVLEHQWNWCLNNGINFTPLLLINGYKYPSSDYKYEDLIGFMEEIIDTQRQEELVVFEELEN